MHGYGGALPEIRWPNDAAVALQCVLNYEEGGENNILHGDAASEAFLSEIVGAAPWPDQRHRNMESIYEYGARAGFWRLHAMFTGRGIPITVYGVATALQRAPAQVEAMQDAGWEIASHGLKWIEYRDFSSEEELAHIKNAIELHEAVTGERPRGWYTGRCSENTVDLIAEEGGFDYVSDSYADDLPYWYHHKGRDQLIIPYTLDCNDMRFATAQGFNSGDQFYCYLKDTFDTLYEEGLNGSPKLMNVGLHCRLIGRPGRAAALAKFLDYAQSHDKVWFARRIEIAEHWKEYHPPMTHSNQPSKMERTDFLNTFGGVFEHSQWVARRTYDAELAPANDTAQGLHFAMTVQFRLASYEEKLSVLNAHPDLAGKLAVAKRLTKESTNEQASAGLDALTDGELERFTVLNEAYRTRFKFPFIIAVKGLNKKQILEAFETRIDSSQAQEFETACRQVERIARLRLNELLPENQRTSNE